MDIAKITDRVKAILTTPKTEWPLIAAEPASIGTLYASYIAILAAIPAIAGFVKGSLIGYSALGVNVRVPIASGVVHAVIGYLVSLLVAYVVALIINALAPTFGGQKDMVQALKATAYAWTAAWIAGIAVIIPWLGWLIGLAGVIYAIYLLYLGLPLTMKCPPEKAGAYTAVSVIIAIVLSWILAIIIASGIGMGALGGAALSGVSMTGQDGGAVTLDNSSALGKLAAMGQRAQQASQELEAAQKSGDQGAQRAAMGKMMGAVSGNAGNVQALSTDQLKALLPTQIDGMPRSNLSASRNSAMGMQVAQASADYSKDGGAPIALEITDTGTARGFMAMAAAVAPEHEEQTDHGYDKTYTDNGRMAHEKWDTQDHQGEYSLVVGERYTVEAKGKVASLDQLKAAVHAVDLNQLEALKNAGVTAN
ncbi:MAG: Yip1 family protein [Rhodanobacter sp.]